jgi:hypothetical protein
VIVEGLVTLLAGGIAAFTLTQTRRSNVIIATLLGSLISISLSLLLLPPFVWDTAYLLNRMLRMVVLFMPYALLSAVFGRYTRK